MNQQGIQQRVIGVIGGMSWESTALYYELLNTGVRERLGGLRSARLAMVSVDFAEIVALQRAGDWDRAGQVLAAHAAELADIGAEVVVLATNTMHKVAAPIESALEETDADFVHIGTVVADAVQRSGITKVGLLGTSYTMEQDFYRGWLEGPELDVIVPDKADRDDINTLIFDGLCQGVGSDIAREDVLAVIDRLAKAGAEGVILGCTELELLLSQDDTDTLLFPSSALHCAAVLDAALGHLPLANIERYETNYDWSQAPGWTEESELTLIGSLRGSPKAAAAVTSWYDELPVWDSAEEPERRYAGGSRFQLRQLANDDLTVAIMSTGEDSFDSIAHYAGEIADLVVGVVLQTGEEGVRLSWAEQPIR